MTTDEPLNPQDYGAIHGAVFQDLGKRRVPEDKIVRLDQAEAEEPATTKEWLDEGSQASQSPSQ